MRTQSQIEASRRNGAKSRGPKTPEGKKHSARNALRHGLFSRTIAPAGESRARYHKHLKSFREEFDPQDPLEAALVEKMAIARWRQLSISDVQSASISNINASLEAIDLGVRPPANHAEAINPTRTLEISLRYDLAFDRQYERALAILIKKREGARLAENLFPKTNLATN